MAGLEPSRKLSSLFAKNSGVLKPDVIATVTITFNNILMTVCEANGRVVTMSTGGAQGFRGRQRASGPAAQRIGYVVGKRARDLGHKKVEVRLKGPTRSRANAVRGLRSAGLRVTAIKDVTPIPHNGCRPRKARRLFSTVAADSAAPTTLDLHLAAAAAEFSSPAMALAARNAPSASLPLGFPLGCL